MRKRLLILILGDIALSVLALYTGLIIRFSNLSGSEDIFISQGIKLIILTIIILFSSFFVELYSYENGKNKKEIIVRSFIGICISFLILSVFYYIIPSIMIGRGLLLITLGIFSLAQFIWHVSYKACLNFPVFAHRVIILGTGKLAKQIGGIVASNNQHYVLAGYVSCTSEQVHVPANSILSNGGGLLETVRREKANKIVISLSDRRGTFPVKDVLSCKLSGVEVVDAPSFYELITGKLFIENITPSWFIFSDGFRTTFLKKIFKRILDICFAVTGLIIFTPIIPIIAILIKIDSPGPVFFSQLRVGEREKNFTLYKFRTMQDDAENETGAVWAQKDDPRITRVGKFLRKMRLDEIPQLYNVLKGDMSFIGPRPERPEFVGKLKNIIPYYSERHIVKPGITGWAQIKYSYGSSVADAIEKLRFDLFYIKHHSPYLDLLIALETLKVVTFGRGGR